MSVKEKVLLLQYYNPTIKINFKEWKIITDKKSRETRITLTPHYLWKIIDKM